MQAVLIIARADGLAAAGWHADTVAAIVHLSGGGASSTCRNRSVNSIRCWEKTRREDVEGPNVDMFVEDLSAQPHYGDVPEKWSIFKVSG